MTKLGFIKLRVPALLIVMGAIAVLSSGCASESSAPAAVAQPTTYPVTLVCEECADIGMEINLWSTPSRSGVAGSVPHNTPATVLETSTYQGVVHYKVTADGITGWVSELFVEK